MEVAGPDRTVCVSTGTGSSSVRPTLSCPVQITRSVLEVYWTPVWGGVGGPPSVVGDFYEDTLPRLQRFQYCDLDLGVTGPGKFQECVSEEVSERHRRSVVSGSGVTCLGRSPRSRVCEGLLRTGWRTENIFVWPRKASHRCIDGCWVQRRPIQDRFLPSLK